MVFINKAFPGLLPFKKFDDLSICVAGYYENAKGHYCKRDKVTEFQIAYCVAGKGTIQTAGKTVPIARGDIFINIPGHPHAYFADDVEPWTLYWVHFKGTKAKRYFEFLRCRPTEPGFTIGYHDRLVLLFKELLLDLPCDDSEHQLKALGTLHYILSTIALLRQQERPRATTLRSNRNSLDLEVVDQTIQEKLRTLTLPELAKSTSRSVPHFIRLFKNQTGHSPMQYVARKKIAMACRLLLECPNQSIKSIADTVGITDSHYFSRLFKKVVGMTPQQYRLALP